MSQRIDDALGSKILALLRLADDETPLVREAVTRELLSLELDLDTFIYEQEVSLTDAQWRVLDTIFWDSNRQKTMDAWEDWLGCEEGPEKLERALEVISEFQNGSHRKRTFTAELDEMATLFIDQERMPSPRELAVFIFDELGFSCVTEGAEGSASANLSEVIAHRHGASISLVCMYILLGRRLGIAIMGCNWPGSFYAKFVEEEMLYMVDFHNRGMILPVDEMLRLQGPSREAAEAVVTLEVTSEMLVRRLLSHLAFYYRRECNTRSSLVILDLLRSLDKQIKGGVAESAAS